MDIQKRINRYINKYASGGSVSNVIHFQKLIKIAESQDRKIVINIDSPGGSLYRLDFKDIKHVKW